MDSDGAAAEWQPTQATQPGGTTTVSQPPKPTTRPAGSGAVQKPTKATTHPGGEAPRDFLDLRQNIVTLTESDIDTSFNNVILGTLSSILDGSKYSWRYNVFKGKFTAQEMSMTMDRKDLKFNIVFGDFDEAQSYYMLELIAKYFPNANSSCQTDVLLPEALLSLCCHQFGVTEDQAEAMLYNGGEKKADDFVIQLKQKVDRKTKTKRMSRK